MHLVSLSIHWVNVEDAFSIAQYTLNKSCFKQNEFDRHEIESKHFLRLLQHNREAKQSGLQRYRDFQLRDLHDSHMQFLSCNVWLETFAADIISTCHIAAIPRRWPRLASMRQPLLHAELT